MKLSAFPGFISNWKVRFRNCMRNQNAISVSNLILVGSLMYIWYNDRKEAMYLKSERREKEITNKLETIDLQLMKGLFQDFAIKIPSHIIDISGQTQRISTVPENNQKSTTYNRTIDCIIANGGYKADEKFVHSQVFVELLKLQLGLAMIKKWNEDQIRNTWIPQFRKPRSYEMRSTILLELEYTILVTISTYVKTNTKIVLKKKTLV